MAIEAHTYAEHAIGYSNKLNKHGADVMHNYIVDKPWELHFLVWRGWSAITSLKLFFLFEPRKNSSFRFFLLAITTIAMSVTVAITIAAVTIPVTIAVAIAFTNV